MLLLIIEAIILSSASVERDNIVHSLILIRYVVVSDIPGIVVGDM